MRVATTSSVGDTRDDNDNLPDGAMDASNTSKIQSQHINPSWNSVMRHTVPLETLRAERRGGWQPGRPSRPVLVQPWPYPPCCKPPVARTARELGNLSGNGHDGAHQRASDACLKQHLGEKPPPT